MISHFPILLMPFLVYKVIFPNIYLEEGNKFVSFDVESFELCKLEVKDRCQKLIGVSLKPYKSTFWP